MPPVRDVIRTFTEGPLAATPYAGTTIGQIVRDQPLIEVRQQPGRPVSEAELVPLTKPAAALLDRPARRQMLTGALSVLDGYEGRNNLHGISLGTHDPGRAMNTVVALVSEGHMPAPTTAEDLTFTLGAIEDMWGGSHGYGAQNLGWLTIGPGIAKDMERMEAGARTGFDGVRALRRINPDWTAPREERGIVANLLGFGLGHELNHSRTPPRVEELGDPATGAHKPLNAIEEGTAEALSRWPGEPQAVARRMGLEPSAEELPAQTGYRDRQAQLGRLLRLGGIDPTRPEHGARAEELLQGAPLAAVPGRIAGAIARAHGLAPEDERALADIIARSNLEPTVVDEVERLVLPAAR